MKLEIKIAGTRVHDVGYRVFLLKNAMNLALPGLSTYNWNEDGQQEASLWWKETRPELPAS